MPRAQTGQRGKMIPLTFIAKTFQAYSRSPLYKGDDGLTVTQLISRCREVGGEPPIRGRKSPLLLRQQTHSVRAPPPPTAQS